MAKTSELVQIKAAPEYKGTAVAGHEGQAIAGPEGVAIAGIRGRAIAGPRGRAQVDQEGIAEAGPYGVASAGERGIILLPWYDTESCRWRISIGYIGETLDAAGEVLSPGTKYQAGLHGKIIPASPEKE